MYAFRSKKMTSRYTMTRIWDYAQVEQELVGVTSEEFMSGELVRDVRERYPLNASCKVKGIFSV